MNNDRFKFRVWDKSKNRYIQFRKSTDSEPLTYIVGFADGANTIDNLFEILGSNSYIIEQCAGLCDRNGKLIYEGDIVSSPVLQDGDVFKKLIKYDENEARFVMRQYPLTGNKYDFCGTGGQKWIRNYEIIGNIHEVKK